MTDSEDKQAGRVSAPIHRHGIVDSTNTVAMKLGEGDAPHLTAVTAEYQTAGRGQPGREWWMPSGQGVLLSVLMRRMPRRVEFSDLTLRVGWSLAERLGELTGLAIDVKQPNDLMFKGKKLGGVLCEARWRGDEMLYAVVGVGIDVNVKDFPEEIRHAATSLCLAAGRDFDVTAITDACVECIRNL